MKTPRRPSERTGRELEKKGRGGPKIGNLCAADAKKRGEIKLNTSLRSRAHASAHTSLPVASSPSFRWAVHEDYLRPVGSQLGPQPGLTGPQPPSLSSSYLSFLPCLIFSLIVPSTPFGVTSSPAVCCAVTLSIFISNLYRCLNGVGILSALSYQVNESLCFLSIWSLSYRSHTDN